MPLPATELILNPDGSVYHLALTPEDIASTIVLVGDPERVSLFEKFMQKVEVRKRKREFVTCTGWIDGKPITVISTGIGTDNIDIVVNELDALVSFDLQSKQPLPQPTCQLTLIRVGTCGGLQPEAHPGKIVVGSMGAGFDNLASFYSWSPSQQEEDLTQAFREQLPNLPEPYFVAGNPGLIEAFTSENTLSGITATAPGFYGPQGRRLHAPVRFPRLPEELSTFNHNGLKFVNFEMETAALYLLSKLTGHRAVSVCVVIGNRLSGRFSKDYKRDVETLVKYVVEKIAEAL